MTKINQIYRCPICGNIVEVLHAGGGELVCCSQPMVLLSANTTDASTEKHVPIIEKSENKITVKVGSIPHPMEADHFIEWIEIIADDKVYKKFLKPSDVPEAIFDLTAKDISARIYCNLHSLWQSRQ